MNLTTFLFSFRGRISRLPFWGFTAVTGAIVLLPALLLGGIDSPKGDMYVTASMLVFIWPSLAVQAKRWHDRNKSAWWILINFLPLIGSIWSFVENGCLKGTFGNNRFGKDPLGGSFTYKSRRDA